MTFVAAVLLALAAGASAGVNPPGASRAEVAIDLADLVNRGAQRAASGDLDGAIADYDAALRRRPDLVEALFDRGNAYRQRHQRGRSLAEPASAQPASSDEARAFADYDRITALRPDFAAVYVNRAILWYERGDYPRAIADCDAAIRLQPKLAEAWNNRSLAWYRSGHYEQAKADFDQTIKLEQFYGNAMIMRPVPDIKVSIGKP